jgi:hypothetical protein
LSANFPLPTDQVELITLALNYKFMDDLDEESVAMGGKRSFFVKDLTSYRWRNLLPQSLSLVIVHVIFSTKEHRPFLDTDTRPKLHAYFATVARNAGCEAYRGGGCFSVGHRIWMRCGPTLTGRRNITRRGHFRMSFGCS